ncbi:MAG: hypothetical protein J7639_11690 [Paenibacillaceae bacterium]|nr:hypothetical protein [Paenibacillaceae bacterium]
MMQEQSKRHTDRVLSGIMLELGTITATGVKLDSFKYEIGDCFFAEYPFNMEVPALDVIGRSTGPVDEEGEPQAGAETGPLMRHSFLPHKVESVRHQLKEALAPGDRVMCAPLNGGHDVVVLCKVVK